MKTGGYEAVVTEKTGLLLDPYFTATKLPGSLTGSKVRATAPPLASCASARSTVPDLATDRRQGPCHRRHQCRPDKPLQHS